MKLMIDIDEDTKNRLCFGITYQKDIQTVCEALNNGTYIPDNATNGDVIKAMFPNTEIMITDERVFLRDGTIVMIYPLTWWNAPYQKGGKE
jgi:hypothetical protein